MLICDTHADTLYALASRAPSLDVTKETLAKGGISLQTLALFVGDSGEHEQVMAFNRKMLAELDKLKAEGFRLIDDPRDAAEGETRFMLSVEGCEIMEDGIDTVAAWRQKGVRMAAPVWNYENRLGVPARHDTGKGLKPFGRDAVREMARVGIAPDVSHLNERGFWDLLDMGLVPLASHSCCKALCGNPRNLTDEQLRALFGAGGYVGVNFYPYFLSEDADATLDTVVNHILHMLSLGGEGKVGFGSDFDGIECKVPGLETPADVPALLQQLQRRGLTDAEISGIAGQNLLRYYDRVFPRG